MSDCGWRNRMYNIFMYRVMSNSVSVRRLMSNGVSCMRGCQFYRVWFPLGPFWLSPNLPAFGLLFLSLDNHIHSKHFSSGYRILRHLVLCLDAKCNPRIVREDRGGRLILHFHTVTGAVRDNRYITKQKCRVIFPSHSFACEGVRVGIIHALSIIRLVRARDHNSPLILTPSSIYSANLAYRSATIFYLYFMCSDNYFQMHNVTFPQGVATMLQSVE